MCSFLIFLLRNYLLPKHFLCHLINKVTKNGPCFETEPISSRTTEIGVDWRNSEKVCFLCRTTKTQDTALRGTAEDEGQGQDTAVCHVTSGT